ncbi:hypothetical protein MA16_Dca027316 [Dendrobium catenatum]|uniref:Uncharacterized protein n=2 Tax=Dendrobium catenatum TaxID=906689 RepID=A0A2I0VD49_9ASPA|nr:hypothetical protein MA16_Dca027316 [Dendrobium catenatum]
MNECSIESCLTPNGNPSGVSVFGSKVALNKRPPTMLFNGQLSFGASLHDEQAWMSSV